MSDRVILHSDCNCFYASVEMLHRPELRHRPMAVGGDPEARHGIVLTANYMAKRSGVKTGMALWQARKVCPDIVFVPPNMDLYLRFSRMCSEIYSDYTDLIEPYGIDECWLDVTRSERLMGNGMGIAQEIRQRIKKELGITVSVGVSFNKFSPNWVLIIRSQMQLQQSFEKSIRRKLGPYLYPIYSMSDEARIISWQHLGLRP